MVGDIIEEGIEKDILDSDTDTQLEEEQKHHDFANINTTVVECITCETILGTVLTLFVTCWARLCRQQRSLERTESDEDKET